MTMTRKILIALSLTTFASPAFADTAPRLAIGGVDIVAYLAKGKPVPGRSKTRLSGETRAGNSPTRRTSISSSPTRKNMRPTMMCMGRTRITTSVPCRAPCRTDAHDRQGSPGRSRLVLGVRREPIG